MRQPSWGTSGTSASTPASAPETRIQTGRAHASEVSPPTTVARKSPRPYRFGEGSSISRLFAVRRRAVHFLLSVAHVAASMRLTLIAAILGSSIVFIDGTVVNVALPPIQHDLGGGLAAQQWIADAYLLTLGSLILVGGSLGDIFGEARVFRLGVAWFGLASVLCAVAPNVDTLLAFHR